MTSRKVAASIRVGKRVRRVLAPVSIDKTSEYDVKRTLAPSVGLLAKLGSILVHVDEGAGAGGHALDWVAVQSLLADPEVRAWLAGMDAACLLPLKRSQR